jgi:hypothetical protein
MVFRRMMGPSLETGTVSDGALSGNCCTIAIACSVMGVQEKCDDKNARSVGTLRVASASEINSRPPDRVAKLL